MKVSRNMFFPPSEYKDMGSIMPENSPRNDETGDRMMKCCSKIEEATGEMVVCGK